MPLEGPRKETQLFREEEKEEEELDLRSKWLMPSPLQGEGGVE